MKPRRTSRHLAAHDLLVLYTETNCFFTTTSTYQGFTSDVDIRTCDLGMSNDSFQKALKKKNRSSDEEDDDKKVRKMKNIKRKDTSNPTVANAMQIRYRDLRRYGGCYAWGQLVGWYKQTVNNPAASLYADRRGTLSLPDIESCYGTDHEYSPSARQTLIERIVTQPSAMWPVGGFWKFKNPFKVYGSPMFDFYLMNDSVPLENCLNEINISKKNITCPPISKLSTLEKDNLLNYMDHPTYPVSEVSLFLRGLSLSVSTPSINDRVHTMSTRNRSKQDDDEDINDNRIDNDDNEPGEGIMTRSQTGKLKRKLFTDDIDDPVINEYYKQLSYADEEDKPRRRRSVKKTVSPSPSPQPVKSEKIETTTKPNKWNNSVKWTSSPIGSFSSPITVDNSNISYPVQSNVQQYSAPVVDVSSNNNQIPTTQINNTQIPQVSQVPQIPQIPQVPQQMNMNQLNQMQQLNQQLSMNQMSVNPQISSYPINVMNQMGYNSMGFTQPSNVLYPQYVNPQYMQQIYQNQDILSQYVMNVNQLNRGFQQQQQQQQMNNPNELSSETRVLINTFDRIIPTLTDSISLSKYISSIDPTAIKSKIDFTYFANTLLSKQVNHPAWNEDVQNVSKNLLNKMSARVHSL